MLEEKSPEELAYSIKLSFDDILVKLKVLSTDNRLKILISLLQGPKTFQELMDIIEIKRTALANHLSDLTKALFTEKIHHGFYRITNVGLIFLQAIDHAIIQSKTIESKQKEAQQRKELMDTFLHRYDKK